MGGEIGIMCVALHNGSCILVEKFPRLTSIHKVNFISLA